ncbi:MAG: N-acetylmuramoyl-L-alanine amidase [Lachnospiraceae bacterium]|nr:N-acetylmuramoyl-L-alanine amidase [Lachnospiraceae bacterium]
MKYYRIDKNGNKTVVEKKKKSTAYKLQAAIKWMVCFAALFLVICGIGVLDKKIDGINLLSNISEKLEEITEGETEETSTEEETEAAEEETEDSGVLFTVCVDPGHGGIDRGNQDNGRDECDDNFNLALKLKAELEALNIGVVMTRTEDVKVFLEERVTIANNSGATYFISLHRNSGDGYGVESWINGSGTSEETQTYGQMIHDAIIAVGATRDRTLKTGSESDSNGGYYVLRNTNMPAVLIELGFMDYEEDNVLFDQNMDAYAKAIADAIYQCYQIYHGEDSESDNSTEDGAETTTEDATEDTEETAASVSSEVSYTGMTLNYEAIEDINSLDSDILNWSQGNKLDSSNIPTACSDYNSKYGGYNADFFVDSGQDKTLYLTFDETYEYGCTSDILSTLKEKGVQSVFFVTKTYAEENPDMVRQIIDEGHILGNLSSTYPTNGLPSETLSDQQNEIIENHEYIKENFGYNMYLFRFPEGKFSEQSLALANNCGYRSVFWSFSYLDYNVNSQPDENESLEKLVSKLHPGAIYLLHGQSRTNADILGDFISQAKAAGYSFASYADIAAKTIQ